MNLFETACQNLSPVVSLSPPPSPYRLLESGILSFGIRNSDQGPRKSANEWNPESSTWNPESTAWNPGQYQDCLTLPYLRRDSKFSFLLN